MQKPVPSGRECVVCVVLMGRPCSYKAWDWLATQLAGRDICPEPGEGWAFAAFTAWMVCGAPSPLSATHIVQLCRSVPDGKM
jgi:hypothetical protein